MHQENILRPKILGGKFLTVKRDENTIPTSLKKLYTIKIAMSISQHIKSPLTKIQ